MKRLPIIIFVALILAPVIINSTEIGSSGGYDLDRILKEADKNFSFRNNDAVFLLMRKGIEITGSGDLKTTVHTVARIASRSSIRSYADLRVPYNSASSELRVLKLRTWREGRWWPDSEKISETAVVKTTPAAVANASSYASMREVMLLHDGVELPCVIETEYEITERGGAERMPGGFEIFAPYDPAAVVEFSVTVPAGTELKFAAGGGAGEPEVISGTGRDQYRWKLENLDRAGSPRIGNLSSDAPYVTWSTAADWKAFGEMVSSRFNSAAVLDEALADSVARITDFEPSAGSKARAIMEFIDSNTRSIHYNPGFWFPNPRPAADIWETAYGHPLDRAVLAAAMLREGGLKAKLLLLSENTAAAVTPAPQSSVFDRICLAVTGDNLSGYYDPETGDFHAGMRLLYGKAAWVPESGEEPYLFNGKGEPPAQSSYLLSIEIFPGEKGIWRGKGYIDADRLFCLYDDMAGSEGKISSYMEKLVRSVIPGAAGCGFSLERFDRSEVAAGFSFIIESGIEQEDGKLRITIGEKPAGGLLERLPSSLKLHHIERSSPAVLPAEMAQTVMIRIRTGGREPVHLPAAIEITNSAGSFAISATEEEGRVKIERKIVLDRRICPGGIWPELRELLLEETDISNRTVILE